MYLGDYPHFYDWLLLSDSLVPTVFGVAVLCAAAEATQIVLVCSNFKAINGYKRPQIHVSAYPMKASLIFISVGCILLRYFYVYQLRLRVYI
jgi:hypothetical protein